MTIPPAPHTDELTPCLARYDRFQHGESCFAASHVDTEVRPELPASLRETAGTNHGSFLYLEPSKDRRYRGSRGACGGAILRGFRSSLGVGQRVTLLQPHATFQRDYACLAVGTSLEMIPLQLGHCHPCVVAWRVNQFAFPVIM